MEEINQILTNEHFFRVKPIEEWNRKFLTESVVLPGINFHHNSEEKIKIYYDFINSRIKNKLGVDFYSANEKNEFEIMFNKLQLQLNSIHYQKEYDFYGQIIEDFVNDVFGCYLRIVFDSNKLKSDDLKIN